MLYLAKWFFIIFPVIGIMFAFSWILVPLVFLIIGIQFIAISPAWIPFFLPIKRSGKKEAIPARA